MKVEDFGDLTPAEAGLIAHLRAGRPGDFIASDGVPAKDAPKDVHIRASLIRALALNKLQDCPLPERGLNICGAYIFGDGQPGAETRGIDLEGAELPGDLALVHCQIPDQILLRGTSAKGIFLDGSSLPQGMIADGLETKGDVFLRYLTTVGEIRFRGAKLGGNLDCSGARLAGTGMAFVADELETNGGVLLRLVETAGAITLSGAKLAGDLDCIHARLSHKKGTALNCSRAQIAGR